MHRDRWVFSCLEQAQWQVGAVPPLWGHCLLVGGHHHWGQRIAVVEVFEDCLGGRGIVLGPLYWGGGGSGYYWDEPVGVRSEDLWIGSGEFCCLGWGGGPND